MRRKRLRLAEPREQRALLGVRPDKPVRWKPGETVTLEVPRPMAGARSHALLKIFWIPIVCINPREDLYYLCFAPSSFDGGAVDGGVRSGPAVPAGRRRSERGR